MRICSLKSIIKTWLAGLLITTLFVIFFYFTPHENSDEIVINSKINFVAAPSVPFFKRFEAASHLNCESYFEKQDNSTQKEKKVKAKLDELEFDMSCSAIMKRNFFPHTPLSPAEESFPLAFAKVVFKDYLYIEADLASFYAPQNTYCFSIDAKADSKFKSRIYALSKCFSNIIYTSTQFNVDSSGHNMDASHLACLKALRSRPWKYVALLQNHDSAIKTNAEMVQIYQWLGGANDVQLVPPIMGRINQSLDWTFKGLNLFKNSTKNTDQNITFAKGYNACSLSRAAVDYIFDELNVEKLVNHLNSGDFGIDEIFIPTLQADDAIGLPGGMTHRCLNEKIRNSLFTRAAIWKPSKACTSKLWRHSVCVFGTEMLSKIENYPHLFGNKFIPETDYGAFECMRGRLYNRTYAVDRLLPEDRLDELVYKTHLPVRYNREQRRSKFDKKKFVCNYQYSGLNKGFL